mmetsp:Transcript_12330/g.16638  ORF Transcript_12330/g.16638 Transcript_12330/m.16638 type:complete len:122 (-) Transcript_12330:73-438(-)
MRKLFDILSRRRWPNLRHTTRSTVHWRGGYQHCVDRTEQTAFWAQMGTFDEEWHRIIRPAEFLVADQADWALQSAEDEEDLCPKNDSGAMFIIGVVHAVCAKYANEPQLDWKILAATSTLT